MMNLLLDIAPLPGNDYVPAPRPVREVIIDTLDSVVAPVQQIVDTPASGGGSGSHWGIILGAIAAALVALGICIFMVRATRKRQEQRLNYSSSRL